jgi:hypothetical protein
MHPSEDRMVCARCPETRFVRPCELVECTLGDTPPQIETLYTSAVGELIQSPVWSPDGNQIAFLECDQSRRHGVERRRVKGVAILDLERHQWQRFNHMGDMACGGFIRWSPDQTHVFLSLDAKDDIGELDVRTGTIRWLIGSRMHLREDAHPRQDVWSLEAVRMLYGLKDRPISGPLWTPDDRYYFYDVRTEGLLGDAGWIERYDTKTKQRRRIRTLWRRLYVE